MSYSLNDKLYLVILVSLTAIGLFFAATFGSDLTAQRLSEVNYRTILPEIIVFFFYAAVFAIWLIGKHALKAHGASAVAEAEELEEKDIKNEFHEIISETIGLVDDIGFSFWDATDVFILSGSALLGVIGVITAPVGGWILDALAIVIALVDVIVKLGQNAKTKKQKEKVRNLEKRLRDFKGVLTGRAFNK